MSLEFTITLNGIVSEERTGDPAKVVITSVSDKPTTTASIATQLPEFVRQEHPKFVEFLKSYYNWLDVKGNTSYEIKRVREFADIDYAKDEFEEALHRQFLVHIPRTLLTNKAPVLKNIRQFYRAKGTEKSFEFFFRTLYNSPAEFYYPRQDILKLSDGKYIRQKSVRISLTRGNPAQIQNAIIKGVTTGTSAFVDKCRVIKTQYGTYYELFLNLSSITGKFNLNEHIEGTNTDGSTFTGVVFPVLSKVEFVKDPITDELMRGIGYEVGDSFVVEESTGKLGIIQVTSVNTDGSIKKMSVKEFGVIYSKSPFIKDIDANNGAPTIKFSLSSATYDINLEIQHSACVLDVSGFINTVEKNAIAKKFSPNSILRINSGDSSKLFQITNRLDLYASKIVLFLSPIGDKNLPANFEKQIRSIQSVVGTGARVKVIPDVFCEYTGYYISNNGQPSEAKYIQDGEFYQQFSYVVYNRESAETYRSYLKDMVHPLGLKFYGGFRDPTTIDSKLETPKAAPVVRKFQQYPRNHLFKFHSIPKCAIIRNGIIQKENVDYTVVKRPPLYPNTKDRFSIKFFDSSSVEADSVLVIYRNEVERISVVALSLYTTSTTFILPSDVTHRRYDEQLLPYLFDLPASLVRQKPTHSIKSPALDRVKHAHVTKTFKTTSNTVNSLFSSHRSIYRDRFKYDPNESMTNGLSLYVQRLNEIELLRESMPSVYPNYEAKIISYTPSAEAGVSQWSDSFNDNGIETLYNTYNSECEKSPNLDNANYWGDFSSPALQYANTQIRHFKYVIPKSLESGDVPEILVIRNGIPLRDNYDYLIVHKSKNPWGRYTHYSIRLDASAQAPTSTDKFEVIYKDSTTKRIVTKRLTHEMGNKVIEIPHPVSIATPNMRINIMPDSVVTRGVLIE